MCQDQAGVAAWGEGSEKSGWKLLSAGREEGEWVQSD